MALLALRASDPPFLQILRFQSFDFFQRAKPREYAKFPVTIVDIDEESLDKVGQWPWPRNKLGELVTRLAQGGAIVVGFDIIFGEADRLSPDNIAADNPGLPADVRQSLAQLPSNENVFAAAMRSARVVVGQTSVRSIEEAAQAPIYVETPSAMLGDDPTPYLERFPDLVQNLEVLERAASGHGVFSLRPDPDGIYRRVPLVMVVRDKMRLALSAEILRIATGGQAFATRTDEAGVSSIVVGGVNVPTDRNGKVWPYFTVSDPARYVSAGSVLDGSADPASIAGHMILVGTSAVGLEDYRATPLVAAMPGVEIHAQVIENVLSQQFLTRPNYAIGMELIFVAVVGLLIVFLVPMTGAVLSFGLAAVLMAAFAGGSFYAFSEHRLLIDATYPVGATLALFIVMATANYIREERQRQQIRGAFGQYISPALVDQLSEDPDQLVLGGETKELSVLFSDVRGFTTISESFRENPQGLTRLMNKFLTALSNAIMERGGTIDKYMGDAVMAFWNAPLDSDNHADESCRAALEMMAAVRALNEAVEAEPAGDDDEPRHQINVGIGINTGECVVGNMGSEMRFDYTALGDTVNLASRLEGQSKPYGVPIVIGNQTAQAVSDHMAVIEIDLIRVKGKNEPEHIFALLGDESLAGRDDFAAVQELNARMIEQYRGQKWKSAIKTLDEIKQRSRTIEPDLIDYLAVYEERITEFRANPPGNDWDGVYVATSK